MYEMMLLNVNLFMCIGSVLQPDILTRKEKFKKQEAKLSLG